MQLACWHASMWGWEPGAHSIACAGAATVVIGSGGGDSGPAVHVGTVPEGPLGLDTCAMAHAEP